MCACIIYHYASIYDMKGLAIVKLEVAIVEYRPLFVWIISADFNFIISPSDPKDSIFSAT